MAEQVATGGLMQFEYRASSPKMRVEQKEEIEDAYEKYYERRENERKRKKILWWIVLMIVLLILFGVWWFGRN